MWLIMSISYDLHASECSLYQHPSALSAVRMQLILFSFFFFTPHTVMLLLVENISTDRVSSAATTTITTTSVEQRPYSNCRQLCHSLRLEMVY